LKAWDLRADLNASVFASIAASTSSAGTMMERIGGRAQGQMSQWAAVEKEIS